MDVKKKVAETIREYAMLSHGDGVLVAVSGGPDSVALLHLLWELREEFGLRLEVAHVQHGLRGEEGREDARFVAGLAERLNLPFHLREVNLPGMKSERGKGNIEAMAREERYAFLAHTAEKLGIQRVATGHSRDDQVETMLMWLFRGSGRRGLGGIPPVRGLPRKGKASGFPLLIRPLIGVSRQQILRYLHQTGLPYRTDRTNLDAHLLRNWLRLHLLPQLRERIDPRVDERLAHLSAILREEDEILDRVAAERLARVLRDGQLVPESLSRESNAMQRRLLRLWLESSVGDLRGVGFHHIEKAIHLIAGGSPQARLSFPRGWSLVKRYGAVQLERERRNTRPVCYSYALPVEGELVISEARMKVYALRSSLLPDERPKDQWEAFFDLALLPETLTVRNFRRGDRFQPLGMQGHKKLKDLFIEKKVPLPVRATLPLLLAGEEILWIPSCGRSEVAKVRPETREVLRVKLSAISDQQSAGRFDRKLKAED